VGYSVCWRLWRVDSVSRFRIFHCGSFLVTVHHRRIGYCTSDRSALLLKTANMKSYSPSQRTAHDLCHPEPRPSLSQALYFALISFGTRSRCIASEYLRLRYRTCVKNAGNIGFHIRTLHPDTVRTWSSYLRRRTLGEK